MKKLIRNIALVLFLGLTSLTTTTAVGGYNITISKGNIVLISFNNIQSEKAYVKLIDADGVQLWSDVVKNTTVFKKQFNLYQLPEGRYTIILKDGDVVHTQEIEKIIDKVYLIEQSSSSILKPESTLTKGYLKVEYPEGVSKLRSVSFQHEDGTIFFSDAPSYETKFARAYNLKDVLPGAYTVILKTDQDVFYESITVE